MEETHEEQEVSETSDGGSTSEEKEALSIPSKRKISGERPQQKKKVKYEDITDEKPQKQSKHDLYRAPTVEELNELKETQNLYNNNLIRLQIGELLKEVEIKKKHKNAFNKWYQTFETFLSELEEYNVPLSLLKTSNLSPKKLSQEQRLAVELAPFEPKFIKCHQDFNVRLVKPESTQIFGLYKVDALPGREIQVNLNLKMPRSCFNVKDFLNNRYFVKRYYYLLYISHFLKLKNICDTVSWISPNHSCLLPVLELKLKESDRISVRIYVTPTENYFKPSRFLPDVNNVKMHLFDVEVNEEIIKDSPTPFYNSLLAHDVTLTENNNFIEQTLLEMNNVKEAIKLIYIWLVQRELNEGLSAFSTELITSFLIYLLVKKRINKFMSSYQVVRNFWNFMVETDLNLNPISLSEDVKQETFETFSKYYDIVFLDKTGCYNLTSFLCLEMYNKIRMESDIAFRLLDDGGMSCFHSIFISKSPAELQHDLVLNISSNDCFKSLLKKCTEEDKIKYFGFKKLLILKEILKTVKKGLNKRAKLVAPLMDKNNSWSFNKDSIKDFHKISLGVTLDPEHAFSILELGPALNDPKESEFRDFWGKLSSDRRFRDGSVCVAVYFETDTIKGRRGIIPRILDWVVTEKLGLKCKVHYDEFEELLVNKKIKASYPLGTNEEGCLKAIAASDDLGKKLRGLEMPLSITGIQGISDVYSFTEVFPPISTNYKCGKQVTVAQENNILLNEKRIGVAPRFVKPIECVLQLEHSSKWPRSLEGIRHMKTAFYLEVSKNLAKKHKIISSVKPEFLAVFYEGFVFRYYIYLSREVGLLKKETTNKGVTVYKESPESREIERKFNILPKICGALKGIQSQHPSYGPSTALVKRWLRAHLIDDFHFPDVAIGLLNASLFVNQSAFNIPNAPQVAFLRFLKFFSELQCSVQPIIVNFNEEISKESLAEIDSKMLQNRDAYPPLYIATPYDNCESVFTKHSPRKEVLRRVKQLADQTLRHCKMMIRDEKTIQIQELFVPNLTGYNVLIHLRPLLNPRRHEQISSDEKQIELEAYSSRVSTKVPVTDFNPVELYLRDLRKNYGEFANFFHNSFGENVIAVLWTPKALKTKEFKVSLVNGRKLEDDKLVLNVDAIIEDFHTLGQGLVKSIEKL